MGLTLTDAMRLTVLERHCKNTKVFNSFKEKESFFLAAV
jgi:hypothetical protein